MNGYRVYQYYIALKSHFTNQSFDFFKYGGKVKQTYETYQKRQDLYFFEKLAEEHPTKERVIGFLLSNILQNRDFYIADFRSATCEKIYQKWLGIVQALHYNLEQDLRKIEEESIKTGTDFRNILRIPSGKITSRFLEMTLEGILSLETYVMVDGVLGLNDYYEKRVFDPLFEDFAFKVKKYSPFINYDRARVAALLQDYSVSDSFTGESENGKDTCTAKERA